jgi:hypothetical protein
MNNLIEKIKEESIINGLRNHIKTRIFTSLQKGPPTGTGGRYENLGNYIKNQRIMLGELEDCLEELRELNAGDY